MDLDDPCVEQRTSAQKGKQRASAESDPSERTPLLPSSSSHFTHQSDPYPFPQEQPHQNIFRRLLIVFLATLVACLVALALIILFALSYSSRVSSLSIEDILHRGLVVEGPDRIDVLNATKEDGVWLRVDARVGLDIGSVLRIRPDDGDLIWTELWKSLGRWGVGKIETISIELSQISVTSQHEPSLTLAVLTTSTIEIPLFPDPPSNLEWLMPMSFPVKIHPTEHTEALTRFANESWLSGVVKTSSTIPFVRVTGGKAGERTWRNKFNFERSNVSIALSTKIPQLPGLPNPGNNAPFPPFSQLVTLKTFHVFSGTDQLLVNASATFSTPIPTAIELMVPSLPFVISVPRYQNDTFADPASPTVRVTTSPLILTHPNTTIYVHGHVAALTHNSFPPLSEFLTSYLAGESPRISLSTPLLPEIAIGTVFPAPDPRPQVLRNVTIKDMKIRPITSSMILASGVVFANVVLPKGVDASLQVDAVYPQLLIYDGPVPDDEPVKTEDSSLDDNDDGLPSPMPLPDPLPANAFARIRPEEWLESTSVPLEHGTGEGSVFAVTAKVVDIPLEVLPGRQREFSNFVGKVIFSGRKGALAGMSGTAAVRIRVVGLGDDEMQLEGLPFCGDARIGKKAMFDTEDI